MLDTSTSVSEEIKVRAKTLLEPYARRLGKTAEELMKNVSYEVVFARMIRIVLWGRILDLIPAYKDSQGVWQIYHGGQTSKLYRRSFAGENPSWPCD